MAIQAGEPPDVWAVWLVCGDSKTSYVHTSQLGEVSPGKRRRIRKRQTYGGLRRVLSCSLRPHSWPNITSFQNRFRLMWNVSALLRLLAGNFWAPSYRPNRFFKLCRTLLKRNWLLRKRQCIRDRKHTGGQQRSVSYLSLFCCRERPLLEGNVHTKCCFENPHFQGKKLRASDRNVILRILLPIYRSLGPCSLVGIKGKSSWARATYGLPLFNPFSLRLLAIFSPLSPNVQAVYLINAVIISKVLHNRLGHGLRNQTLHLRLPRQRKLKLLLGKFGTCVLALPKIA